MTSVPHSGAKSVTPGGSVAGHTPGPWKVFTVKDGPNKGQLLGVGEENGAGVADAHGGLWGSGAEKMANARLIAAAPDAFGLAVDFIQWVDEFTGTLPEPQSDAMFDLYRRARRIYLTVDQKGHDASRADLIAKATAGETRNAEGVG